MSNNVQPRQEVADSRPGGERRASVRQAAGAIGGSITARIIGGSQVDLVNFSNRGVLFECDSRLLIGARASVRITTNDANLIVTGRVVRSRVKGLVNGALRYDAALVLDHELALTPAVLAAVGPLTTDDPVALESAFDSSFDPSPVDAYVAESEASLLEVSSGADRLLPAAQPFSATATAAAQESGSVEAEPVRSGGDPEPFEGPPEVAAAEPTVALEAGPVAFEPEPVAFEAEPVALEPEPIAFEPEAGVAFEASVEFAFDDVEASFEPAPEVSFDTAALTVADPEPIETAEVLVAEPAPTEPAVTEEFEASSMFEATYTPAAHEAYPRDSQFEVTSPTPVPGHDASSSSFFDASPSQTFGDRPAVPIEPGPEVADLVAGPAIIDVAPDAVAVDLSAASEGIEFDSEIAFEAEDVALFEQSFDDAPAGHPVAATEQTAPDEFDEPALAASPDHDTDQPAAVPDADDRVLLQFAATVPHDLAELRRIAADNQW